MDKNEKMLLLECLLYDIRLDWANDLRPRLEMAKDISVETELWTHYEKIDQFIYDIIVGKNIDGREFRRSYEQGGYEGMALLHGLSRTFDDRSDIFKTIAQSSLNCPEYIFIDHNM